jgi:hypothetical protein
LGLRLDLLLVEEDVGLLPEDPLEGRFLDKVIIAIIPFTIKTLAIGEVVA